MAANVFSRICQQKIHDMAECYGVAFVESYTGSRANVLRDLNARAPIFATVVPYKGQLWTVQSSHSEPRPYKFVHTGVLDKLHQVFKCNKLMTNAKSEV